MAILNINYILNIFIALFLIGIWGLVLNRKNILITLMSIELMLLAINLNFVIFSIYLDDIIGYVFVLFILTIAATEFAIGLEILALHYKKKKRKRKEHWYLVASFGVNLATLTFLYAKVFLNCSQLVFVGIFAFFYKMYSKLRNMLKRFFFLTWFNFIIYHKFVLPVIILLKIILRKSIQSQDLMFIASSPENFFMDDGHHPRGSSGFQNSLVARNLFGTPSIVSSPSGYQTPPTASNPSVVRSLFGTSPVVSSPSGYQTPPAVSNPLAQQNPPMVVRNLGGYHTPIVGRNVPMNPDPLGIPNLFEGPNLSRNSHGNPNQGANMPSIPRNRLAQRLPGWEETHRTPLPGFYSEFNENASVLKNALTPNEIPNQISIPNNGNFNPPLQPTLTDNDISHQTNNSPVIKPKFELLFHKKND